MGIPVIDLFAGPGGLGEGFSSLFDDKGNRVFEIGLSIETDLYAHQTLLFRSFYRQFKFGHVPDQYYDVIRENDPKLRLEKKSKLYKSFPFEYAAAESEAWNCTLGSEEFPPYMVDSRISQALTGKRAWILIGGPPCQAYSMAGRSRIGGIDENDHRVYLYREYLRIIAAHQPDIFIMENVRGLLSAKLHGESIFSMILRDLRNPARLFPQYRSRKYKIFSLVKEPVNYSFSGDPEYFKDNDFLIKAENYGIPQKRHRVILLGIREDFGIQKIPVLSEKKNKVRLSTVINRLPVIRSGVSRRIEYTISNNARINHKYIQIKDSSEKWKTIIKNFGKELNYESAPIFPENTGKNFIQVKAITISKGWADWFHDPKLNGVCNHESRMHLEDDLKRYLFAAIFSREKGRSPKLGEYPEYLLPKHKNAESGLFTDRFRVQIPDEPATTITSHIAKDGHYFIHYDPIQARSLTVREAARIQTFPDNYYFWGPRTEQYRQVGNAVPPLLARQIAQVVYQLIS